jgi:hypothetical protein
MEHLVKLPPIVDLAINDFSKKFHISEEEKARLRLSAMIRIYSPPTYSPYKGPSEPRILDPHLHRSLWILDENGQTKVTTDISTDNTK